MEALHGSFKSKVSIPIPSEPGSPMTIKIPDHFPKTPISYLAKFAIDCQKLKRDRDRSTSNQKAISNVDNTSIDTTQHPEWTKHLDGHEVITRKILHSER